VSLAEVASVAALVVLYLGAVWKLAPPEAGRPSKPAVPTGIAEVHPEPGAAPPVPSLTGPSWTDATLPPPTTPPPWVGAEAYDTVGGNARSTDLSGDPRTGEKRLDDALERMESRADWLADNVPRFRDACLGPQIDAATCDLYRADIMKVYRGLERGLRDADAEARSSGVEPRTVQDLRSRHHVDEREWDDLTELVRRLNTEYEGRP
jgi:hypothetical protein